MEEGWGEGLGPCGRGVGGGFRAMWKRGGGEESLGPCERGGRGGEEGSGACGRGQCMG